MSNSTVVNPYTLWASRASQQALRDRTACIQAARDVESKAFVAFTSVVLVEYGEMVDLGTLRIEPDRLVFAGNLVTRVVPFGSVVLLGAQPLVDTPGRSACSVNSVDYPATLVFRADSPLEYHISAWYSRWLDGPCTEISPSGTV